MPALGGFFLLGHLLTEAEAVENRPNTVSCPAYLEEKGAVPPAMSCHTITVPPGPRQGAAQLASGNPSCYLQYAAYEMYSKL